MAGWGLGVVSIKDIQDSHKVCAMMDAGFTMGGRESELSKNVS